MASADTSLFSFSATGLEEDTFTLLRFEAKEMISGPSWIHLSVVSEQRGLEHDDLIGKEGVLQIHLNGEHQIHGVICQYLEEPFDAQRSRYEFVLRGRVALLEYRTHCQVFQKKSSKEVLEDLLKQSGMDAKSYKLLLTGSYGPMDLQVQYNESDFAFFSRTAEREGIFYFDQTAGENTVLVLGDANSAFVPSSQTKPMEYRPGAGMVETDFEALYSLQRSNQIHLGKIALSGYNYKMPGSVIRSEALASGNGESVEHDVSLESAVDATTNSRLRLESERMVRDRIRATTHNPKLRAGTKFQISTTQGYGFGGDYLLVEIHHEGSQEGSLLGSGLDAHYKNEIFAQPVALPYRTPQTTRRPKVAGVIVAKSDGPQGPYAHLDEEGRYRARLPFDQSSSGPGEALPPLRLAQPYAGPGYGLHLPIHPGADLVLAFEDGDIHRPIALGAVPNPATKTPVAASNRSQSTLRSASGNLLVLDDLEKKTKIQLTSAGKHKVLLDDEAETSGIVLETNHKQRLKLDDKGSSLELSVSDNSHALTLVAGKDGKGTASLKLKSGQVLQLDEVHQTVTLQTAKGHVLQFDDDLDKITISDSKGKHTIEIDASGKITLKTEGDLQLEAKGSLDLKAKDIHLQATGKLDLKAAQDLSIQGMNVSAKADQMVAIQAGMDAGIQAGMNLKLEGSLNVESKAGVANKMTGTMTNVESSALNTIKGAMVMIN